MSTTTTVLLSTAYLAPVEYYVKLLTADRVLVEQYDHYMKQTYRNRCTIAGPSGPLALTVPVVKPDTPKCFLRDIRISEHGNWRHLHWNALESAYNHTPFFEYYKDDFRPFYEQRYEFLMDFNEALCRMVCGLIDMSPRMERTADYLVAADAPALCGGTASGTENCGQCLADYRERIHPKRDYRVEDTDFIPVPYYQVFRERLGFLPNLSIVDLLFNMGPESLLVLRQCAARSGSRAHEGTQATPACLKNESD